MYDIQNTNSFTFNKTIMGGIILPDLLTKRSDPVKKYEIQFLIFNDQKG